LGREAQKLALQIAAVVLVVAATVFSVKTDTIPVNKNARKRFIVTFEQTKQKSRKS
jgi:hypothetical protein